MKKKIRIKPEHRNWGGHATDDPPLVLPKHWSREKRKLYRAKLLNPHRLLAVLIARDILHEVNREVIRDVFGIQENKSGT